MSRKIPLETIIIPVIVAIVWIVTIILSVNMYTNDFADKAQIRSFYQSANRIDNKSDYDYLNKTGAGRSIIQTKVTAQDPVTLPQMNTDNKYSYIRADYQEYRSHIETYTVTHTDSKGHVSTETKTRIVWRWDDVGSDSKQATTFELFGHKYNQSLFDLGKFAQDIPIKDVVKGASGWDNCQETGYHTRTLWSGVPQKFNTTFYADFNGKGLQPIKFPNQKRDEKIRLHKNQPIKKFLENELKSNTPHPIRWTIFTIILLIFEAGIILVISLMILEG